MTQAKPVAIKVENVSKHFLLPHQRSNSIKGVFTNLASYIQSRNSYEIQNALKDISFEIRQGEFFGIVGRNGSGKSTLLKILAGIYQPNEGKVTISGRLVPFIELGVGFNGELTGRENVYLSGALMGFSKTEIDKLYDDIVGFAELANFMDQKLKNYSSGMQVRLAFSLAIRADADILLVDEVLAVGDADFQRKCFRYFKQLKKEKKTVVFVTHDMNAVREYCDRGAFIENSELLAVDKPDKVAKLYEQLLMPRATVPAATKQSKKWGDGTLKMKKPKVLSVDTNAIVLSVEAIAEQDCDDPIFGFVLRNAAGISLLGTNTMLEKLKQSPMKAGQSREVTWTLRNVLADGDYTVTLAAQYDNGMTIGEWWEDACSLRVTRPVRTPYLVDPGINVVVK